jgi:hypothetical protein
VPSWLWFIARRGGRAKSAPREAQIEALDQPVDAWVHLELVAGAEVGQGLGLGLSDSSELDEFGEESLEAGRRDDLEKPRRLIAGVPESVALVARGLKIRSPGPPTTTSSPSSAPTCPSTT